MIYFFIGEKMVCSVMSQWKDAMEMHHARCCVFKAWSDAFHKLLQGAMPSSDFDQFIHITVTPKLMALSASIKALRGGGIEEWAMELQKTEKQHFDLIVEKQRNIVVHLSSGDLHSDSCKLVRTLLIGSRLLPAMKVHHPAAVVDPSSDDDIAVDVNVSASCNYFNDFLQSSNARISALEASVNELVENAQCFVSDSHA